MKKALTALIGSLICLGLCGLWQSLAWGMVPGDLEPDGQVNFRDLALLAAAWHTDCNEPEWNPALDISYPNDCVINNLDLLVLCWHWLDTDLMLLPAGEFSMGDHFYEGDPDELPLHTVYVDSFCISSCEVTNQEYCDYLNSEVSTSQIQVVDGVVYASSDSNNSHPY